MATETKILLGTIYNGDFGDYRDTAEEMSMLKNLPVKFSYGGYSYTVEYEIQVNK